MASPAPRFSVVGQRGRRHRVAFPSLYIEFSELQRLEHHALDLNRNCSSENWEDSQYVARGTGQGMFSYFSLLEKRDSPPKGNLRGGICRELHSGMIGCPKDLLQRVGSTRRKRLPK